jgi:CRISP-associated protein Cas1
MLLYLDVPGCGLSVRSGCLIVKSGLDVKTYHPASHSLRCIIVAAAGFVTSDAMAWASCEHVTLLIVRNGEFLCLADSTPGRLARRELALRSRQMRCVFDPKRRLVIARALVAAKIETLRLENGARLLSCLARTRSIQDAMVIEAEAGAAYWRLRKGFTLAFKDGSTVALTSRARSWRTGRLGETGKQFSNRFALNPINAMLNYSGAIIIAQCVRASAGLGLDPAFGMLHSDRPGMSALAWDIFELLRVRAEAPVSDFINSRQFNSTDFKLERLPKPHMKFTSPLGRDLAAHVLRRVPFSIVVKACRTVAELL